MPSGKAEKMTGSTFLESITVEEGPDGEESQESKVKCELC